VKDKSPRSIVFLVIIVLLVAGSVVTGIFILRTDTVEERVARNQLVPLLFTVHNGQSAVLIEVFLFHPETKKGTILYLPNRTWLMLESLNRYDTLETLYAPGKPQTLLAKIEKMIDVKIPFYVDLSLADLGGLVDLMGGIEVLISAPVRQTVAQRLFLFESGSVTLDGDKAADFLELELEADTDMERAQRRQDLLKALLERFKKSEESGFLRRPEVFSRCRDLMKTNMSTQELQSYLVSLATLKTEGILYRRVHGTTRVQNQKQIFLPNDQGEQLRKTMVQAVEFLTDREAFRPEDLIVNLEILNGTEKAFRARDCARIYKKYGYEVIREGNAPDKPVARTVIVDYRGNEKLAGEISAVIKCKNIERRTAEKPLADVTIILGMDFDGQYCQ
jgi:polyisoprenyl-teichoic acid--peptidoglycan teichoic acid transferase